MDVSITVTNQGINCELKDGCGTVDVLQACSNTDGFKLLPYSLANLSTYSIVEMEMAHL